MSSPFGGFGNIGLAMIPGDYAARLDDFAPFGVRSKAIRGRPRPSRERGGIVNPGVSTPGINRWQRDGLNHLVGTDSIAANLIQNPIVNTGH